MHLFSFSYFFAAAAIRIFRKEKCLLALAPFAILQKIRYTDFRAMADRKDKGVINLLPQHKIDVVRDIIPAIRAGDLSVSTSGLNAVSGDK